MTTAKTQIKITSAPNKVLALETGQPSPFARLLEIACTDRYLAFLIAACAGVKYLMAICLPFIGDEAYIALWGKYPAWGYYDHPPMLGWLIHLLTYLGSSPLLLRLLPIVFSVLVAAGIYAALRHYDKNKACLAAAFFMACPFNMVFIFITPDVPLMLFAFVSAFFLFKAENSRLYRYYLLSGVFLGLAFLSKYFAVLLGLSYLVYFLSVPKNAAKIKGFILLMLGAVPFIAQNIVWNYSTGWPNIMHNWYNRLAASHSNPVANIIILFGIAAYAFTPPALYFLFKNKKSILAASHPAQLKIFAFAWLIPLCMFVLISFGKTVSPHWVLFMLPFACIVIALLLDTQQLLESIKFAVIVSVSQAIFIYAIPLAPLDKLKGFIKDKDFATLILNMHPDKVLPVINQYSGNFILATDSFSASAILEYSGNNRVIVIGKGTNHGRQDDIWTNFKQLDGADILILQRETPDMGKFEDYFDSISTRQFEVNRAEFYLLLCHDFKYQRYREKVLSSIVRRYYKIPGWLPRSESFFHTKYNF